MNKGPWFMFKVTGAMYKDHWSMYKCPWSMIPYPPHYGTGIQVKYIDTLVIFSAVRWILSN